MTGTPQRALGFFAGGADFATLSEIAEAARAGLAPDVRDFLDGGAGREVTLGRNRDAFERWAYRPRVMTGLGVPDMATSFLGIGLGIPVLTAPFGADGLFHPEGHCAVARANAAEGVVSIVPEGGTHAIETVAAAAPAATRIAQLHPMGDPSNFDAMLRRIEDAGYDAVCVTVDCPTTGWREGNRRNRFDLDPAVITGNYPAGGRVAFEEVFGQLVTRTEPVWTWAQLGERMTVTRLPWMAKGVLTAESASAAVDAGASAVLVSNHGGRQLDGAPAALDQLPEIAAAVGGRAQIALDSGIRSGSDVVTALALGADAVVIGRLAAYGLAAAGEAGVRRVHQLVREEMQTILTLLGVGSVRDLGPEFLQNVQL
ncbi:alpha-hydroxy acid oxidase [Pseudonocardia alaniniphila]|uniref:Alpha-hydroxy-acid oxidizing protein n=1 Tax=Pseudonocardia alaniniphila TaxID=75291 RepID=A0ABS9TEF5_9PSEU|nr:alpha-hydroxy acid oxidase [Pseudonocardia alaniniphila]MCH6166902.1 alpha-hydroxy-acid oxidizing protein [Pseudonocardia alaniniphila]